jgi:hypothetical protein
MADDFVVNDNFPRYQEIVDHHEFLVDSVDALFANPGPEFVGATPDEIEASRVLTLSKLEQQSTLSLLACLEAYFRVDYLKRKEGKLKDPLSKSLIKVFNKKKRKASLMEDIIKTWLKSETITHAMYNHVNKAFKFRHWMAHGQYWPMNQSDVAYDFYEVASMIEGVMNSASFHLETS